MFAHQEYLAEKEKIDQLLEQGYLIAKIEENLSGAFVDFVLNREATAQEEKVKQLQVLNPDTRKYISVIVVQQQQRGA